MNGPNTNSITFEFARKEHLAEIKAISDQTYREHCALNPDAFGQEFIKNPLDTLFDNSFGADGLSQNIIVCLDGAKPVGHVAFWIAQKPREALGVLEKVATIGDISFQQEFRNRQLGKQALRFLLPVLEERGVTQIEAQVWFGNTASEKLFEAIEFNETCKTYRLRLAKPGPLIKPTRPIPWLLIYRVSIMLFLLIFIIKRFELW